MINPILSTLVLMLLVYVTIVEFTRSGSAVTLAIGAIGAAVIVAFS